MVEILKSAIKSNIKLILFIFMLLFGWAASAELSTYCEYRLLDSREQPLIFERLDDILESLEATSEVRVHRLASLNAIRRFGLGADSGGELALELERSPYHRSRLAFIFKKSGKIFFKVPLNLPPLYVWRKDSEEATEGKISLSLPENVKVWHELSFGSIFENDFGLRKYISFEASQQRLKRIVLGVDVDCSLVRNYSHGGLRRHIVLRPDYFLCRVPVLIVSGRN